MKPSKVKNELVFGNVTYTIWADKKMTKPELVLAVRKEISTMPVDKRPKSGEAHSFNLK